MNGLRAMIYPSSTSPDLLIRRPDDDDRRAGSQNEGWDIGVFWVGAAEAAVTPVAVESSYHTATAAAEAASPLDDFLSGQHHHRFPFGFTLSTPSSNEHEHKSSSPAAMPSEHEKQNEEEGSCDESSLVSEMTQMTYRAELMKQVSSDMILILCMCALICGTAANFFSFSSSMIQAIMIELEKFRQQKKQQGVETHPKVIKTMFARTISCPDTQQSITSFINAASVKMKAEERQNYQLEEVEEEQDAASNPTIQRRVDELYVEFGVRPTRSIPNEMSEENTTARKTIPSNEQRAVTDHHLDSVIQLKLQLAQKQAVFDELSSKYNALLLQKRAQHSMVAENSCLRQENERLRAQLHQAGMTPAAPAGHQLKSSLFNLADSQDRLTSPSPSQPSHSFNIHQVLQDRLTCARVETKKDDGNIKAYRTPPKRREFESFGTISTATDTSSATNESPPSQPSLNPLNSFSNIIQGWRNNRRPTAEESSDGLLHRSLTMRTAGSTESSVTPSRRRGKRREWGSALMLQRPLPPNNEDFS
jgi:regulator of replication initiation timing